MITTEFNVFNAKADEWRLYPIGDLQFGAPGFQEDLWQECADRVRFDKNALTIGMGDYSDHWRPTNEIKLAVASAGDGDFRDSIDELYRAHNRKICEKLEPVFKKGRCLGLLSGHHEHTYANGISSTQELCEWLGVPYLHEMAYLRLNFCGDVNPRHQKKHMWRMKIHAQHGDGGAGMVGPDVSNLERKTAPYWNAELFLRGHSTKRWGFPVMEYDMTPYSPPRAIVREKWLVNTGGFMAGHIEGRSTYVSRKNMPPARLGYNIVTLRLERKNRDNKPDAPLMDRQIKIGLIQP